MLQRTLPTLLLGLLIGCGGADGTGGAEEQDDRPRLAFVSNGVDPFWSIAAAGVEAGNAEFDASCDMRMPKDVVDQKSIVEDLLVRGVQGIAISPIDSTNQTSLLDQAATRTQLITVDCDAPDSTRRCFIGVDNYEAGRMAGQLVKEALPDGGSVIIFVGRLEQDNARRRRLGVIDELLGVDYDPERVYPASETVEGGGYTIIDTRTDQFDYSKAKSNAEDALAVYPDLDCMVGLFAYNPPNILEALRNADKLGEVAVVGFDEQELTLQGIIDGTVVGTVVQDPYEYGRQSVRVLAGLARGEESVLPPDGRLVVPAKKIGPDNVESFRSLLAERLGAGSR